MSYTNGTMDVNLPSLGTIEVLILHFEKQRLLFIGSLGIPLFLFVGIHQLPAQEIPEEQIETLGTIEVPATVVIREERQIVVPDPELHNLSPLPESDQLIQSEITLPSFQSTSRTEVVRDNIATRMAVQTRVKPAKAERPPYPRFAREQGWEGTVVLRIQVTSSGSVDTVNIRNTSGYPLLDNSAVQSVKTWTFEPAKDGEFPIPVTVDLPIRFNLDE